MQCLGSARRLPVEWDERSGESLGKPRNVDWLG